MKSGWNSGLRARGFWASLISAILLLAGTTAAGQSWKWTIEQVDASGNTSAIFLTTDPEGDVHASYANDQEGIMYAFRPAGASRWFTMPVEKIGYATFTRVAVDSKENPHICYTAAGKMKYAALIDSNWQIQQINPGSGTIAYSCSVGVAPDGTPQVTWYQERTANDLNYLHFKYAILQDGRWLAKTIDFDAQTGKWHQMLLDSAGHPHIAYDAFVKGEMRYAYSQGNTWKISRVDSRELGNGKNWNVGMGNSLALDDHGNAYITYYHSDGLYYARQTGTSWSIVKVDDVAPLGGWLGYRSSLVLNSRGFPRISYEDAGILKFAFWDGTKWNTQVLVGAMAGSPFLFSSMTIDSAGTVYVGYRDPADGSLKVAVGVQMTVPLSASSKKP